MVNAVDCDVMDSDEEPGEFGPRRISKDDLSKAFADGWIIKSIKPSTFATNPNFKGADFSPGGPKAWFTVARRT